MDVIETIVLDSDSEHEKDTVDMEIEEIVPKNEFTWVNWFLILVVAVRTTNIKSNRLVSVV